MNQTNYYGQKEKKNKEQLCNLYHLSVLEGKLKLKKYLKKRRRNWQHFQANQQNIRPNNN